MVTFLIISTLAWGIAEIFYKKGNDENEKYSHLKTTVFVGFFMGIYALVILFTQGINLETFPLNFLYYLPVALCYIISMVCSYFGVRFIEESIADPIENSSGALVAILCAIILKENFEIPAIIGIILISIGLICIGLFDKIGKENRVSKYGKKLAVFAIAMPFCYLVLDAVGTFLDIFYTESVETTLLVGVTESTLEHTANTAYELTFFLFSICLFIFLKIKKIKIFDFKSENKKLTIYKVLAAIFETIGQATYLFALSKGSGVAAVILGAGTVIVSLLLSRIVLKEKITKLQYLFILLMVLGIVLLSI